MAVTAVPSDYNASQKLILNSVGKFIPFVAKKEKTFANYYLFNNYFYIFN